jgi:hypothetical protein
MADWYGSARSNYFRVKDIKGFRELCSRWDIECIHKTVKINGYTVETPDTVGFLCNGDFGGLPSYRCEKGDGEDAPEKEYEFEDFLHELSELLAEGEVAVNVEAGAEKLRYVTGYSLAVNSKGEMESVSLDFIYDRARRLGQNITRAEY